MREEKKGERLLAFSMVSHSRCLGKGGGGGGVSSNYDQSSNTNGGGDLRAAEKKNAN